MQDAVKLTRLPYKKRLAHRQEEYVAISVIARYLPFNVPGCLYRQRFLETRNHGFQWYITQQRGFVGMGASVSQAKGHTLFSMGAFGRVRLLGKLLGKQRQKEAKRGQLWPVASTA